MADELNINVGSVETTEQSLSIIKGTTKKVSVEVWYYHYPTSQWIDISSYVMNEVAFYWCKRNKDYSPVLNELNLVLKETFTYSMLYYDTTEIRDIYVKVEGVIRFTGYVKGYIYQKETHTHNLEVVTYLHALQRINVGTNIWTWASGGSPTVQQYYDDGTYRYLAVLRALWCVFYQASIGIDYSDLTGSRFKNYDNVYYLDNINYEQLKFDVGMLACLNQPKTAYYSDMLNNDTNVNWNDNKIDGFQFLSLVCSFLGCVIVPNGAKAFKLYKYQTPANRNYTPADKDVYGYGKTHYDGEVANAEGWSLQYELGDTDTDSGAIVPSDEREHYYIDNSQFSPRTYKVVVTGNGLLSIDLMKHFMIIMENGQNDPPTHNVANTIAPYDAGRFLANAKYFPHYVETFSYKIDFTKPCVLENYFVYNSDSAVCEIQQEDIYVTV